MSDDNDPEPIKRYMPTEDSLDLAEEIAKAIGQPFDRAAIMAQSETLHETMFADLAVSLDVDTSAVAFRSGAYTRARAFVGRSARDVPHLVLDLVFDFCISSMGHIMVVMATIELSPKEVGRLHRVMDDIFSLFVDAHRFERLRENFFPLMREYHQCLMLSHALTRSMTVSVICHELAHIELGHLRRAASADDEFDADARGAELFLRHVREGGPTSVYVDPKLAASPVLLLRMFDLYEAWLEKRGSPMAHSATHPPAAIRADRVEAIMRPHLGEKAVYILDGISAALGDLKAQLKN